MEYFQALRNLKTMLTPEGKLLPVLELILVGTKIGYGLAKNEKGEVQLAKGLEMERITIGLKMADIDKLIAHLKLCKEEMQTLAESVADVEIK